MKGGFLLDVVVAEGTTILELLASKDKTLLVWRDTLLVLDLSLDVLDGVTGLDLEGDGLSSQGFDEDLHTSTKTKHQVKGRFLLDVVVAEGTAILELFASENETLLVWRDAFLVLDLSLDVLDGVTGFDLEGDGLSSQGFDEDLHTSTKTKHQVKGRFLLDVVVAEGTAVLELFASENETLLVWRDPFLVLNLGLDVLDGVAGLHFEGDGFARQRLYENLHTAAKAQNEVKRRLLLNVVVAECAAVLELFAGENETLLVWRDTLLVLDLSLDVLDGVTGFDLECDGLSGQRLDKDLHATTQTEHQVKGRLFLDVVVAEGTTILELLASEDETLLVWRDAFLVLNLGLDVLDGVAGLDLEGDGLSG